MPNPRVSPQEPKYQQVLRTLQDEILSGRYEPGEKLGSEAELGKRFSASRITIGRAVRELRDLHLVERRAGSGTYVRRATAIDALTFGLLIPNLGQTDIFEPICRGMADAAGRHALLWGSASEPDDRGAEAMKLCQRYIDRKVSGVFFAPLEFTGDDQRVNRRISSMLDEARIPVVLLDRCYLPYPRRSAHDLVGIDNARAGFAATEHLMKLGSRRVAFLSPVHAASTIGFRIAGYHEALLAHGRSVEAELVRCIDVSDPGAVRTFLDEAEPDAVVCANDRLAAGLMPTLSALDRRVPHDIRLVGIDDVGFASLLPVPLTTVRQPCREIGLAAMETMLARLARPRAPIRDVLLATTLVVRKSCGA